MAATEARIVSAAVAGQFISSYHRSYRVERGPRIFCTTLRVLCDFAPGDQAAALESTLTFDNNGAIYGTTLNYRHLPGGAVFTVNP
jgi:hypothetical protein